jgi:protein-S-isoprenylcysteine O-methyltransferase Ste14
MGLLSRALLGLAALAVVMGALVFLAAGTTHYLEGWIFLSVFFLASAAITFDLLARDPRLLARRVRAGPLAEKTGRQQLIQLAASLAFLALLAVSALDRRWSWSRVPAAVIAAGDALVAIGFFIVSRVFRANTFTSAVVEVAPDQRVISTGPYAIVRHPMYAGGLILLAGIPLALGSYRGLLALVPMTGTIVWRLLDEERVLGEELPGYDRYREKTRYRLIPGVW